MKESIINYESTILKKLYIDVTQAYNWVGPVAGIIRVMDELAVRFANDDHDEAVFVVWNEQSQSFTAIDFLKALVDRDKVKQPPIEVDAKRSLTGRVRRLLKNKEASLPEPTESPVSIEYGSIFFTPHGGVWESEAYISKIMEMKNDGVVVAQVLYDLCPVLTPQFCSEGIRRIYKNYMSKTLPVTDLVLAISENTANDCQQWLKSLGVHNPPKLTTFRLGDELNIKKSQKPSVKLPEKFIICVGTVEARKNHTALYYAYKLAVQNDKELPTLLVVGRRGWLADDIYEIVNTDPDIGDKIRFLHGTTDKELTWFYEHAMLSIFPSFYEGWGLPVAESLLRGTPCIASETSSIPEIGGDLVDYISPYSPEQIMQKIHELSTDFEALRSKKERIAKEYKSTSWDDSFNQVLEAINSLS